jgi:SAM-dependent methyltransferase
MKRRSFPKRVANLTYACMAQFADPFYMLRALREVPYFIKTCYRYSNLLGGKPFPLLGMLPQLHDRTASTPFSADYFYMGAWATRRLIARNPARHVDIGGANFFISTLTASIPVIFLDYRPLHASLSGFHGVVGDILALPFADDSIQSLSCLHVAEHIGLGRYGDKLDPNGTQKAIRELSRITAPGGDLLFALPVGVERLCFNAHRIHAPATISNLFQGFDLIEFSGVHDDGTFVERANLHDFDADEYGCGLYWFRKR